MAKAARNARRASNRLPASSGTFGEWRLALHIAKKVSKRRRSASIFFFGHFPDLGNLLDSSFATPMGFRSNDLVVGLGGDNFSVQWSASGIYLFGMRNLGKYLPRQQTDEVSLHLA